MHSPLHDCIGAWAQRLAWHPDAEFADYVLSGIQHGFRVGFSNTSPLSKAQRNMHSAQEYPEVIDEYIARETVAGRFLGPFTLQEAQGLHVSRFGVIPKGHATKWRFITDLSFPDGASVNDGIDPHLCSLQYTSVHKVAQAALRLGHGALLAKLDIKSAYRLLPTHPDDRPLLGVQWKGSLYVDAMLPFGLRSAPKIFTAVADALEWCFRQERVTLVDHYLDDYITMGPPGTSVCQSNLDHITYVCEQLGVPLALEKLAGPTTCLEFLGIEIDTREGVLRLPADKQARLQSALRHWSHRRACKRKQLESLIGIMHHTATVIKPGRSFLRHMIELLRPQRKKHHYLCLNRNFHADLNWWRTFAAQWNGAAILPPPQSDFVEFASDASGAWGCGAWHGSRWLQMQWQAEAAARHIAFKELLAVVAWGPLWKGRNVRGLCDNLAAVQVVGTRSCRDSSLMHLLRCLFFLEAHFQCSVVLAYIPGVENTLADNLSRDRLPIFLSKAVAPDPYPSPVNPALVELFLDPRANWTSQRWTQRFSTIVREA